jgi:hypothetical protein
MCTEYLHHIHPPTTSSHILPTPIGTNSPDRAFSDLLFSTFVKKIQHFCLFKIVKHWFACDISCIHVL